MVFFEEHNLQNRKNKLHLTINLFRSTPIPVIANSFQLFLPRLVFSPTVCTKESLPLQANNELMFTTAEPDMGHLATLTHQRAIKRLIIGLDKLYEQGKTRLEALPETDIDPGNPESRCPDIILRDNVATAVPVIIEVATHFGARTDLKKLRRLIEDTEYGIEEGFVYDFEQKTWLKYSKVKGQAIENTAWSDVLQFDLSGLM
jgi:hypothetical protein